MFDLELKYKVGYGINLLHGIDFMVANLSDKESKMNNSVYEPEYNLLKDSFLGYGEKLQSKLEYLANLAQDEIWDYSSSHSKTILYNYLCFTYDKIKEENKISYSEDNTQMCFNTGLLTKNGSDIYAYFVKNTNKNKRDGQDWFLIGFKQVSDKDMRSFRHFPEIADYFTDPSDFIYDRNLTLYIDYDHIISIDFVILE